MRALACLALGLAVTSLDAQSPRPIPYDVVAKLPAPPADHRLPYGTDSLQFGELRLPKGIAQNRPVVVLIHGGCWQGAYDIAHSRPMAAALADAGFAVWSIEYRRIGNPGGGWPNTFHDVALGTDFLRTIASWYCGWARGLRRRPMPIRCRWQASLDSHRSPTWRGTVRRRAGATVRCIS
jgi:acetyl esterase/lipase